VVKEKCDIEFRIIYTEANQKTENIDIKFEGKNWNKENGEQKMKINSQNYSDKSSFI